MTQAVIRPEYKSGIVLNQARQAPTGKVEIFAHDQGVLPEGFDTCQEAYEFALGNDLIVMDGAPGWKRHKFKHEDGTSTLTWTKDYDCGLSASVSSIGPWLIVNENPIMLESKKLRDDELENAADYRARCDQCAKLLIEWRNMP